MKHVLLAVLFIVQPYPSQVAPVQQGAAAMRQADPPIPFKSDGCSAPSVVSRLIFDRPEFQVFCEAHDLAYWRGGTYTDRLIADARLMMSIAERGFPIEAELMFSAIRAAGGPGTGLSFRWGYGWPNEHGYDPPR